MIIKISRHIFGSHRGYRTLAASNDITPDESAELESFVFGQTNVIDYIESLNVEPAYWSRTLSSGRRAISRVLPGQADEHGRQSLQFVTAVIFGEDWINLLKGEDAPLLKINNIWTWNNQHPIPRLEVDSPKPPRINPNQEQRKRIISLLAYIETLADSPSTTIAVEPHDFTQEELAMVFSLLPYWFRPRFSYAIRGLSESLPVNVNYLAPGASRGKSRRKIILWSPSLGKQNAKYTSGVAHFWEQSDTPPWTFVENCKAFGQLQPTWEGTDSTVGITADLSSRRVRDKRKSIRIPTYVYWLLALLMVISTTGVFVYDTIKTHREADATLTAAEEFLTSTVDSLDSISEASEQAKLIQKAKEHAKKVAALQDESRLDRQTSVSGALDSWLQKAGVQTEQLESFEELLAGFRTFSTSLGLDNPEIMNSIPSSTAQYAVDSWKKKLEKYKKNTNATTESFSNRIDDAIDQIVRWETRVESLIKHAEDLLVKIEKHFSEKPPIQLSNALISNWQNIQKQLDELGKLLPEPLERNANERESTTLDNKVAKLRESLEQYQDIAEEWEKKITAMKNAFQQFEDDAKEQIKKHKLEYDPTSASDLSESWKAAQEAASALDRATSKWPDAVTVLDNKKIVTDWMNKASMLAINYFSSELKLANEIWERESKRAENTGDSGNTILPNPNAAQKVLEGALQYWSNNADVIVHFDQEYAEEQRLEANMLLGKLKVAEDKYKASIAVPSPTPEKATPGSTGA